MRRLLHSILPVSLLFLVFETSGQICSGNLGENIFTDGDFGSGTANVVQTNPMTAPGYQYTTNPPPSDGYYVLSNNLGAWPGNFATWLDIGDNSNDPNGYMMVVNASFTPGLFYKQLVEGLCENTLYVFTADVINLIRTNVTGHIDPNVSFLIDGEELYTTGSIGQDETWNTYGFTFTTAPGQTSVELSLRNNAPGGVGNDLAIDNIEFRACGPEALILPMEIENICEDGSPIDLDATIQGSQYDTPAYQWQQSFDEGLTWQDIPGANGPVYTHTDLSSGYYYYRYLLANGPGNLGNFKCRVVSNVKIVYVVPKFHDIIDTICTGLQYIVEDHAYDQSGIYVDSLISSLGCDSIVTLDLTVVPDSEIEANVLLQNPECFGAADGHLEITSVTNGALPYVFTFEDYPPGNATFYEFLTSGDYLLKIEDRYGCYYEELFTLYDPPEFYVDLGEDVFIELGASVKISPNTNFPLNNFFWTPDPLDCNPDCWELEWNPPHPVELKLTAVSEDGCIAEDIVNVHVIDNRKVFIPNVFSPNDDGINDYFSIFADIPNVQSIQTFTVFDRWGGIVFEQKAFQPNQQTLGWNGRIKGDRAPVGIYTYFTEILFFDGEVKRYSGDVMLIR